MEKALLVTIKLESERDRWPIEDVAHELEELAVACQADVINNITCNLEKPTANLFIGSGKAEELALICHEENIDTVIFSQDLSGTQQRNLEEIIGKKIIDRTQMILEIFARHARSPEGKMQVELAQLQYLLPRLTGKGIILSRMGGGIGSRGPGEQKLETDRRRIRNRIIKLQSDLKNSRLHRGNLRKKRIAKLIPTIALVGYTNAGKSTLINALTDSHQEIQDGLFTTLDTVSKNLQLLNGENVIISDTVGFLHKLPHRLIEAFKATLEEVVEADLLIHVIDVSHARVYEHAADVKGVLKEIGADQNPVIIVLNKTDLLADKIWLNRLADDFPGAVAISAKLKENLEGLLKKIEENFQSKMELIELDLPHSRMDLVDLFYREGKVKSIKYLAGSIKVRASLPKILISKYLSGLKFKPGSDPC